MFEIPYKFSMKNIELYRTVEKLVEMKMEKIVPKKASFAMGYCKEQMKKKKLLPYDPRSKMNRIMKNFNHLDTYVNVEDILQEMNKSLAKN